MYQQLMVRYASINLDPTSLISIIKGAIKSGVSNYKDFETYMRQQIDSTGVSVEEFFDMLPAGSDADYTDFKYKILAAKDEPIIEADSGSPAIAINILQSSV